MEPEYIHSIGFSLILSVALNFMSPGFSVIIQAIATNIEMFKVKFRTLNLWPQNLLLAGTTNNDS